MWISKYGLLNIVSSSIEKVNYCCAFSKEDFNMISLLEKEKYIWYTKFSALSTKFDKN